MESSKLQNSSYSVYPGQYVPMLAEEQFRQELRQPHESAKILPPFRLTNLPGIYKVEVMIPGVKREEFLVLAEGNKLSVCVIHQQLSTEEDKVNKNNEFSFVCYERDIRLEEDVDAEFVSAEYRSGVLELWVPKTNQPARNFHSRIVVY